jgi:DNA-binding transcriptional ArsR family regulator
MVECRPAELDATFHALSNATRRALLARLGESPATISTLSAPFEMTFYAVSKHLKVLEEAGLVEREVVGREHRFALRTERVGAAAEWLAEQTRFWNRRLDALEQMLRRRRAAPRGE